MGYSSIQKNYFNLCFCVIKSSADLEGDTFLPYCLLHQLKQNKSCTNQMLLLFFETQLLIRNVHIQTVLLLFLFVKYFRKILPFEIDLLKNCMSNLFFRKWFV